MLTSKRITEIIENDSEFCGCANSCNKFVASWFRENMKLPMILLWKDISAPLLKGQGGQCLRHSLVLRRLCVNAVHWLCSTNISTRIDRPQNYSFWTLSWSVSGFPTTPIFPISADPTSIEQLHTTCDIVAQRRNNIQLCLLSVMLVCWMLSWTRKYYRMKSHIQGNPEQHVHKASHCGSKQQ